MAVASIPGFNVQKIGKNKYAVSVNNGNLGAAVVNKSELKMLADMYGGKVNDGSTAKKIISGLALAGAVTAAVVYRKNIGKFFKGIKDGKIGEFAEGAKTKIATAAETVKNKTVEGAETIKDAVNNGSGKVKNKAGKCYNKAADWVVEKWHKIVDFFKGLFGKKADAVQQELPFPKNEKAGVGIFSKIGNSVKKVIKNVKNLFVKKDVKNKTIFGRGLSPELEKAKVAGIVENAKKITLRPSGTTPKEWRSALAEKYGALNVH